MFLAGWLMTLTDGLNLTLKLLSSNLSRALVSANLQVSTSGNVRIRRSHLLAVEIMKHWADPISFPHLLAVEIMKHWAGAFLHRGGRGHVITFVVANFKDLPLPTKPCHAAYELKKRTGFTTSLIEGTTDRIYS